MAETSHSDLTREVLTPPVEDTAATSAAWAQRLAAAVRAEVVTEDEAYDAWCAASWMPPESVEAICVYDDHIEMKATGRRKHITGDYTRTADGFTLTPRNRNHLRGDDLQLLAPVADLLGVVAGIRGSGRPRGRGKTAQAVKLYRREVANGASRRQAAETARLAVGWGLPAPGGENDPLRVADQASKGRAAVIRADQHARSRSNGDQ